MKKIVLVYGAIAGIIAAVTMVISTAVCYNDPGFDGMWVGFAAMILAFSFVYFGAKKYRDQHNNGFISFGEAFQAGVFIALVGSTMYVLTWLIDYYIFIPDFMDKYVLHVTEQATKSGATLLEVYKQRKEALEYVAQYKNPLMVIFLTYMEILPIGIFIALVSSFVLMRKKKIG